MATTPYDDFLPEVLPEVPDCPETVAINAIRNAAIEFFDRSRAWRYEADPISSIANQPAYDLEPPRDTLVVEIMQMEYQGMPIAPKLPDWLNASIPAWRTKSGLPCYRTQDDERTFRLVPMPAAGQTGAITMMVALKPTRKSTGIDSRLYEEHLESIAHGAKARLKAMAGKAWSDPGGAAFHLARFEAAIEAAKLKAHKGFSRTRLRVRAHFQ